MTAHSAAEPIKSALPCWLLNKDAQRLPGLYQSIIGLLGSTIARRRPDSGPVRRLCVVYWNSYSRGR
ncbi:MAG TPA: hypothetical protein PLR07_07100 [Promineifilum sp.]|nr:hypothetical protein [Promineifilum sp.]